ncbi:DNA topoisomerase IV subunit A [Amnibacterium sp. CER49]|uniref:DNA gyrase/topoisomerase IV subunit A n=1 Tax=Amnibacterium sp. CER49 TaxID=3039161 RepID=UPI0024495FF4|nr:DNA topoisomerase IV subunit A [Amnibacterium sp. CER49]MDH2442331.1 DNA topoisomerase IV subunit A [Amnibacterium sp. CER49]
MTTIEPGPASGERIEDVDVSAEMQGSFLEYAYSVIYSRALPDARDGLKPVQRRILYQMADMGLRPDRGHVKSARVVGDVMGKLHPHGDSAIYDALVRMAQPFSMRLPLIDGHGNFGSLDDGPAAARYTEARLAAAAMAMVADLDEDVVDFVPNYDNQLDQPDVLPASFPNLLVNGASGIAVGMATNMAPHNLVEVIDGARHLIAHPDATLDDLMRFIPGPDLPTGGTIVGLAGVRDAYATGRGAFRTRAKVHVEQVTARKSGLVVTELPYTVGPERVIEKIKDGVNAKKLQGISGVDDLTDGEQGLKLVIEIKTGFDPMAVLEQLYRYTPLEESFNINNVALVEGGPRTLGLLELLQVYIGHRIEVVTRRTRYRLGRREERLHLVEGLLVAILDIDRVIAIIRGSDDTDAARTGLIAAFSLSQVQAEYILELRLRRLTRFSTLELEAEAQQLRDEIAELRALLDDPGRLRTLVSDELGQAAELLGTPRRTLLTEGAAQPPKSSSKAAPVLEIQDVPCRVLLSTTGRAVRIDLPEGEAVTPASRRSRHDAIRSQVSGTSRGELGAVTNRGRLVRFSPVDLPVVPSGAVQLGAGTPIGAYLGVGGKDEHVLGFVALDDRPIALGTAGGVVKRVAPGNWPNKPVFDLIALKDGDEVVGVGQGDEEQALVFVTTEGQLLRFPAGAVRPQGAAAGGMAGISLGGDARVLAFAAVDADEAVVATVSATATTLDEIDPGRGKLTSLTDFPAKGRATGGVRAQALGRGETGLTVAWVGPAPALAVARDGAARRFPDTLVKRDAPGLPLDAVVDAFGTRAR